MLVQMSISASVVVRASVPSLLNQLSMSQVRLAIYKHGTEQTVTHKWRQTLLETLLQLLRMSPQPLASEYSLTIF